MSDNILLCHAQKKTTTKIYKEDEKYADQTWINTSIFLWMNKKKCVRRPNSQWYVYFSTYSYDDICKYILLFVLKKKLNIHERIVYVNEKRKKKKILKTIECI